jgi:hypothetical protein
VGRLDGDKLVIGWKEYVDFVEWGISGVRAKVDTGALTSVLDVASYSLRDDGGQGTIAELRVALDPGHPDHLTTITCPVRKMVVVANSSGLREHRPLVETDVRLGSIVQRMALTVTNRAGMRFRMILGRRALRDRFVVDVSRAYTLGRHPRREVGA